MFTFIDRINALLMLMMLGLVDSVVAVSAVKVMEKTGSRLGSVRGFGRDPHALQYMKRTSLACRISGVATAVAAQKKGAAAETFRRWSGWAEAS